MLFSWWLNICQTGQDKARRQFLCGLLSQFLPWHVHQTYTDLITERDRLCLSNLPLSSQLPQTNPTGFAADLRWNVIHSPSCFSQMCLQFFSAAVTRCENEEMDPHIPIHFLMGTIYTSGTSAFPTNPPFCGPNNFHKLFKPEGSRELGFSCWDKGKAVGGFPTNRGQPVTAMYLDNLTIQTWLLNLCQASVQSWMPPCMFSKQCFGQSWSSWYAYKGGNNKKQPNAWAKVN